MSGPGDDQNAFTNYRFARGAVIILGGLIVLALAVLVLGFAFKGSTGTTDAADSSVHGLILPPGAHIQSMEVVPGRLILRVRSDKGEEIDIVDTGTARLVGQVRASASRAPANENASDEKPVEEKTYGDDDRDRKQDRSDR